MAVRENWIGNSKFPIPISSGYTSEGMLGVVSLCSNVESVTSASIGLPLRNVFAMIVAENDGFDLLPRGALGEICFAGDQIGRSDTGKFIDHPEYGPIYRTGDRGRILSDGTITLDSSLKVSGQFIDIDEIDRALLSSGLVQDSVSIVLETPHTDQQQLATIWTPTEEAQESTSSKYLDHTFNKLRTELSTRLPTSSLPSFLIRVDKLPMNKSHLVDFVKIREDIQQMDTEKLASFSLQLETEESDPDSDTASNEIEQVIASALSTVTGMDLKGIRRHTSFYKIGLDSLSAISFSRTLQENGIERLPVSTILQRSSIAQLAMVAKFATNGHVSLPVAAPADDGNENGPESVFDEDFIRDIKEEFKSPAQDRRVQNIYPCTPLQEAMLAAKSDAESAYFNHLLLRVNADIEELKSAWTKMLERHDILRTCFRPTSDNRFAYAQIVLDGVSLPWSSSEVSPQGLNHDVEKRKSEFESRSPVQDLLPYSLTIYVDTAANTTHLLLSIHHALYDGEGIAQLLHELQTLLAGQSLPETTPFHQFINYMLSTNTESSDTYWDRYLSGITPRLLPPPTKTSVDSAASQQIQTNLNVSFSTFKTQCKTLSVAPLNVFHASWARLLSFYAGSSDICFGNVFSCRTIPLEGASQIVGPCFNTLPMRVKLTPTSTNADMMKQCQKHNADILPYQLTPLRRVQKRVLDGGAGSKLFDTLIILQTRGTDLDPQYWELLSDEGNMGFPLICEVIPDEKNDVVSISLHFQKSYLEQDIIERLARDFVDIVAHTTSFPSSQASDKRFIGGEDVPRIFEKSGSAQIAPQIQSSRPWSSQEETIRDILTQYSRVDLKAIQLHTTIFQLGLDSINAVQVSGKLYKMGYKVSAGDILEVCCTNFTRFHYLC